MKQLIQSYKTGELGLFDVPPPALDENGILGQHWAALGAALGSGLTYCYSLAMA
jgi:polar amino acid transport system substrate-binding protein